MAGDYVLSFIGIGKFIEGLIFIDSIAYNVVCANTASRRYEAISGRLSKISQLPITSVGYTPSHFKKAFSLN